MTRQNEDVTPQPRGDATSEQIDRIKSAQLRLDEAQKQLERAVVQALAEGASFRGIADATGIAGTTAQRYARAHGWPPPEVVESRKREQAARDAFAARMSGNPPKP